MNTLDITYQTFLRELILEGDQKLTRNGSTLSLFGTHFSHKMSDGFPLLTTKKVFFAGVVSELKWFLRGETNICSLLKDGCNIWNDDAYRFYVAQHASTQPVLTKEEYLQAVLEDKHPTTGQPFQSWGSLGPIYGAQWRHWKTKYEDENVGHGRIDQIANLLDLLKTDPDSRRMLVSAWNPSDLNEMALPPCHYAFQVRTRKLSQAERFNWYYDRQESKLGLNHDHIEQEMDHAGVPTRAISLLWNQRSVDTFLGLPFNIASYGLLLTLLAHEVNMVPENLKASFGDTHLYLNHLDAAREQLSRDPRPLPTLEILSSDLLQGQFEYNIEGYLPHPAIKAPLSV
jgi:thymidylate synthase